MEKVRLERVAIDRDDLARRRRRFWSSLAVVVVVLGGATVATGALTRFTGFLQHPAVVRVLCGEGRTIAFVTTEGRVEGKRIACLDAAGDEPDGENNFAMLTIWSAFALLIGAPAVLVARRITAEK